MKHNVDIGAVIEAYKKVGSIYSVAKQLSIGKSTVHRILKEHNITKPDISQGEPDHNDLCKYYLDGNSALNTATKFGTSPSQVYRILAKQGIPARSISEAMQSARPTTYQVKPRSSAISRELLMQYYISDGMTLGEISSKTGINASTLNYHRRKYGLSRPEKDKFKIRSRISRSLWADEKFKNDMSLAIANSPKVSSLQTILYSILDDLDIKYYREYDDTDDDVQCRIGPYSFDCVIPRLNKPWLLIECQGEYWHSLPRTIVKDEAKASYIAMNHSDRYEVKYLWEYEFSHKDYVSSIVRQWLDIDQPEPIDFDFNDIEIGDAKRDEYKLLLGKYHYLPNAGRGGLAYGAYLGGKLIAVCVFSPMVRQNIADNKNTRELSRLCIHPRYHKKNFASWFISRCIKRLPSEYENIITYSDSTYGHSGTVYLSANFKHVATLRPDYWYGSPSGWIMHKRTLYGRAKAMRMTETEYAIKHGYRKVYGKEKQKFLFTRYH